MILGLLTNPLLQLFNQVSALLVNIRLNPNSALENAESLKQL
jgi:hypothetical protein